MMTDASLSRHAAFFTRCLSGLPPQYTGADATRATLLFFALGALDLLDRVSTLPLELRTLAIDWVYSLQLPAGGFRGAPFLPCDASNPSSPPHEYEVAHLTMTYNAIQILLILGDDLSRLNRSGALASLRALQNSDGSFLPYSGGSESDMRFVYCAAAICHMLNDYSHIDVEATVNFILSCQSYQHGFGQRPLEEAHAGSTYCAIASLSLLGKIDSLSERKKKDIIGWLVTLQNEGFCGRTGKVDDTCYSFWVGGALSLLSSFDLISTTSNLAFLARTETKYGGFGKLPEMPPDLLHAYMGVASLALMRQTGVLELDAGLNLAKRTGERLKEVQKLRNWVAGHCGV